MNFSPFVIISVIDNHRDSFFTLWPQLLVIIIIRRDIIMRFTIFTFAFLLMPFIIHAQEATPIKGMPSGLYEMDRPHASITWKVSHMGLSNYTARFTDFDIDIMFDAQDPVKSRVKATINPTSIETDYPDAETKDFNKELAHNAGWFNGEQFPKISFLSNSVELTGDDAGKIKGNLEFLGVKKTITLDVKFNKAVGNHPFLNKPAIGFSATTTIKRSEFGMTKYIPQIGDNVDVIIEAEFLYAE